MLARNIFDSKLGTTPNREISEHPAINFLFKMIPEDRNTGAHFFDGREILFIVKNEKIEKVTLLDVGTSKDGHDLQVIERSETEPTLILEDKSGLIRMILKADAAQASYVVTINHPNNRYRLEPTIR